MTDQEKKILEQLKQSTEDIPVPESLHPNQIQKLLDTHSDQPEKTFKNHSRWLKWGLIAAALVLVVGIGAGIRNHQLSSNPATASETADSSQYASAEELQTATNYEDIYAYLQSYQDELNSASIDSGFGVSGDSVSTYARSTESASDTASNETSSSAGRTVNTDFSDTNIRTEGVDEADIVKTDGNYLYTLKANSHEISIIDISTDQMKIVSTISLSDKFQVSEFYLDNQKLFILGNVQNTQIDSDNTELYTGSCTRAQTYDLTDITKPKSIGTVDQSGYYRTSRYSNGFLYLFSDYYISGSFSKKDYPSYVPLVGDNLLKESDIYLPTNHAADQYLVISSISADTPDKAADQKAIMSENGEVYVSTNNIYIYEYTNNSILADNLSAKNQTIIRKLSYKDGKLSGSSQGKVKGYLNDSFSIDEYKDTLRLVTTVRSTVSSSSDTNSVYVLDKDLKTIGKIEDLAKGEQVYSARFFDDTGYFVTYKQTDPLFSVDFSDPENPKIIGELKIPGFSEYLHFYDDNLLLGIGMDTDENGVSNGVKISMFDISDPSDVKEINKYTLSEYYYSDVFYDYHAALIDSSKNMIGFPISGAVNQYVIFSYNDKNGFELQMQEEINGNSYLGTRGVYANDRFYVINGNAIESYRIEDYEKIDDLLL